MLGQPVFQDNGVKLVDPRGDMLEQAWEAYATALANSSSPEDLVHQIHQMVTALQIDISKPANVIYARDTRPSGPALVAALIDGLKAAPGGTTTHTDEGVLTTPILHYLVRCKNTQGTADAYGTPTEEGYYEKLSTAFKKLLVSDTFWSPRAPCSRVSSLETPWWYRFSVCTRRAVSRLC
jgi:phosphoacetylglucosamine mutase